MTYQRKEQIGDATLYLGDCLEILPTLEGVGAVVADPPYSSGGQFRSDRMATTSRKYVQSGGAGFRQDFSGDNRDQRAFYAWATLLFSRMFRACEPGAPILVFTDWRQLPTMADAIQGGGYIWRNIVTWWKPGVRMQRGRFSGSAEYVLYGTSGVPAEGEKSPQNVLKFAPVGRGEKGHIAEKPVALLEELIGVTSAGSKVLDPFMGSGTTGIACARMGRPFIGCEIEPVYFDLACERIEDAYRQGKLFEDSA